MDSFIIALASASADSACAEDNVTWEALKLLPIRAKLILLEAFNRCILALEPGKPGSWFQILLTAIPKIAQAGTFKDFRWIGIAAVLSKLFCKCLVVYRKKLRKGLGTSDAPWAPPTTWASSRPQPICFFKLGQHGFAPGRNRRQQFF